MAAPKRKDLFLKSLEQITSLDSNENDLAIRCKFNFSYFTKQSAGQDFGEIGHINLISLCEKLCNYSKETLNYWLREKVGKGNGHILEIYGNFPKISDFKEPKCIPHQVRWGRFRIDNSTRLVGFVIPDEYHDKMHHKGHRFDKNTFYVVFIDENHVFYKTKA